jgi:dTDP-4-amino-4,6-dideoxygalactose transaminase
MNDLNAAIGIENLKSVPNWLAQHRTNGHFYDQELQNVDGIRLLERKPNHNSSYWIYTLLVDNRSAFQQKMLEHGIHTSQVHTRLDKHSGFGRYYNFHGFVGLEDFSAHHISIPVGWWVTEEDRAHVVKTIKEIGGK